MSLKNLPILKRISFFSRPGGIPGMEEKPTTRMNSVVVCPGLFLNSRMVLKPIYKIAVDFTDREKNHKNLLAKEELHI